MRLASGDVRDHIFSQNPTTDHRIGATGLCCGRAVKKSTFAEFLVPFDFRLLQQYPPTADAGTRWVLVRTISECRLWSPTWHAGHA